MRLRPLLSPAAGLALLVAFLLAGEWAVRATGVPLPGSVAGMLLLFVSLRLGAVPLAWVRPASDLLLRRMGLFFVPPGVGLMAYGALLRQEWPAIVGASVVSTLAVLLVVGSVRRRLERGG